GGSPPCGVRWDGTMRTSSPTRGAEDAAGCGQPALRGAMRTGRWGHRPLRKRGGRQPAPAWFLALFGHVQRDAILDDLGGLLGGLLAVEEGSSLLGDNIVDLLVIGGDAVAVLIDPHKEVVFLLGQRKNIN